MEARVRFEILTDLSFATARVQVATKNTNIDGEGTPHQNNEDVQLVLTFNIQIQPMARTRLGGKPHIFFRLEVTGINIARKRGAAAAPSDATASTEATETSASQAVAEQLKSKGMPSQEAMLRNLQVRDFSWHPACFALHRQCCFHQL